MSRAEQLLDPLMRWSPLQWNARRRARGQLAVLAYHSISDREQFARQLDYLVSHTTVISLADLRSVLDRAEAAPEHSVMITFDDADRTLVDVGAAMLEERGIRATAFVVAGYIDTTQPFWWEEVEDLVGRGARSATGTEGSVVQLVRRLKTVPNSERLAVLEELRASATHGSDPRPQLSRHDVAFLADHGFDIGSHSLTHPCLDHCTDDELGVELAESRQVLGAILGEPPDTIAYPNGDFDARVVSAAARAGYRIGFGFDHQLSPASPPSPLEISRVRVNAWTNADRFATIVSGLHPSLHRALGRQ